jgi:hypothetical protein
MSLILTTTAADFVTATYTPAEAVDLTTVPGEIHLADGYNSLQANWAREMPDWVAGGWSTWQVYGLRPGESNIVGRIRVATTEEGLAEATWSPFINGWMYALLGADGMPDAAGAGMIEFNIWMAVLNLGMDDVGPWIEQELRMKA